MELDPGLASLLAGLVGLLVGSFLNVVIYRLPKMMELEWERECASLRASSADDVAALPEVQPIDTQAEAIPSARFNLCVPASRCGTCGHQVRWYENIPVLSYVFLRGKCSACGVRLSLRYPIVELATAFLFFYCIERWGMGVQGLAWCGFSAAMLTLAFIDWDTTLLPDDITLPLMWAGLLAAALGWIAVPLYASVVGAAAGYLSLWTIYWAFKWLTGKEGMGYGDFKLYAALGAWFGWEALLPIILISSLIGAVVGIAMKLMKNLREGGYIPFGPFLVGAGFAAMFFGPQAILQTIMGPWGR
jgi:leader peptidase (prepilin peptidase)/N-methyltransferase